MTKKTKKVIYITAGALALVIVTAVIILSFAQFQPKDANLIQNGDFEQTENGLPAGWYTESYDGKGQFSVQPGGYDGGNCIRIINDVYEDSRFVQKVNVNPNAIYRLSAWIKTENVSAELNAEENRGCANVAVMEMHNISPIVKGDSDWIRIDFYGQTATGQRSIMVAMRLGFYSAMSKGTAYFDKVELVQVDSAPEGVTVASWAKTMNGGDSRSAADVQAIEGRSMGLALLFMLGVALVFTLGYRMNNGCLRRKWWIFAVLALGLFIRMYNAMTVRGFYTDINCFASWAREMADNPLNFYTRTGSDYPPLYMIWLGIPGLLSKLLNIPLDSLDSPIGLLLLKSAPIVCDLLLGWFIYKIASKKLGVRAGVCISAVYVLNPAVIINSASWGQVDSVLILFIVLAIYFFIKRQYARGVFSYLAAMLIKPQALIFAPIMLFGAIKGMTECAQDMAQPDKKELAVKRIKAFAGSMAASVAIFFLLSWILMPAGKNIMWLFEHYFSTMGQYQWGTLSAFGFFGLIGGQWVALSEGEFLGISYNTLNVVMLAAAIAIPTALYWVKRTKDRAGKISYGVNPKNRNMFLAAAVIAASVAAMPAMVHERYMFPALALILMAFVVSRDKRLIYAYGGLSGLHYLNVALVLYAYGGKAYTGSEEQTYMTANNIFFIIGSALTCLMFIYLVYVAFSIRNGHIKQFKLQPDGPGENVFAPIVLTDENAVITPVFPARERLGEEAGADGIEQNSPLSEEMGKTEDKADFNSENDSEEENADTGRKINSSAEFKIMATLESKRAHDAFRAAKKRRFDLKDFLIMGVVTVIYGVLALSNLGLTEYTPTSYWETQSAREEVIIDFGDVYDVERMYINPGVPELVFAKNKIHLYCSEDGTTWNYIDTMDYNGYWDMFKWLRPYNSDSEKYVTGFTGRYFKMVWGMQETGFRINEVVFYQSSTEDIIVPIKEVQGASGEHGAACLVDEQETAAIRNYQTCMYFDEPYHARTAYEYLNNWNVYEWTHPPLGKAIISAGISLFGMNPFGWRFFGAVAGIIMVPLMYIFGKLLFKKRAWATALMLLMTLDGMHYVQTRIATIDSYSVLFIILMFVCMYKYYTMSFYEDKLWKTFIPLGLCGIFFGVGAATKWICLYAGVGLAIIFFISLGRRIAEYFRAVDALKSPEKYSREELEYLKHISDTCMRKVILTLLFCVLFFVIIPVIIYCLSYIPYFDTPANAGKKWYDVIWDNQKAMLDYHSNLKEEKPHSFRSPWYEWPVLARPMWFYSGVDQAPQGMMECISCCGNPLIWWAGLVCTPISIVILVKKIMNRYRVTSPQMLLRRSREIKMLLFISIGLASNFLAWLFVPRSTFIYHYFASLPFIMMFTVYVLKKIYEAVGTDKKKKVAMGIIGFFALALLLFVMFLPVFTGTMVSRWYVDNFLVWLPSWFFHG